MTVQPSDFNNIKLLCNFNGADGATTIVDESAQAHTITNNGTGVELDTAEKKFGSASLLLPGGAANYLSIADSDDWHFNADFCIEFFIRGGFQNNAWVIGHYNATGNQRSWGFRTTSGGTALEWWTSTSGSSPAQQLGTLSDVFVSPAEFKHVCVCRAGSDMSSYVNGTRDDTTAAFGTALHNSTTNLTIGGVNNSGDFNGRIDGLRICRGESIYDPTATSIQVPSAGFGSSLRRRNYWF